MTQSPRPFVLARDAHAVDAVLGEVGLRLNDVRILRDVSQLQGHYNGLLYTGSGADAKLIASARERGFIVQKVKS